MCKYRNGSRHRQLRVGVGGDVHDGRVGGQLQAQAHVIGRRREHQRCQVHRRRSVTSHKNILSSKQREVIL